MELLWITVAAFFAALGMICFVRMMADSLFFPRQMRVEVILRTREDADLLDMLLHEARFAFFSHRAAPIVLIGEDLREDRALLSLLEDRKIEYRLIL